MVAKDHLFATKFAKLSSIAEIAYQPPVRLPITQLIIPYYVPQKKRALVPMENTCHDVLK